MQSSRANEREDPEAVSPFEAEGGVFIAIGPNHIAFLADDENDRLEIVSVFDLYELPGANYISPLPVMSR